MLVEERLAVSRLGFDAIRAVAALQAGWSLCATACSSSRISLRALSSSCRFGLSVIVLGVTFIFIGLALLLVSL